MNDANTGGETDNGLENIKKRSTGLKFWRCLRFMILTIMLLAVVAVASPMISRMVRTGRALMSWEKAREATLTLLRSENLLFLVTDKLTTQIVVHASENNPLMGKREGFLVATVTLYYGMDLSSLTEESIVKDGTRLLVAMPDPVKLDFSIDPASLRTWTVRSGLNVIADFVMSKNIEQELRGHIESSAIKFYTEHGLLPSRESIISKLNALTPGFREHVGLEVVFI